MAPVAARYLRLFYPTSQGGNIIGGGLSGNDISSTNRLDGLGLGPEAPLAEAGAACAHSSWLHCS